MSTYYKVFGGSERSSRKEHEHLVNWTEGVLCPPLCLDYKEGKGSQILVKGRHLNTGTKAPLQSLIILQGSMFVLFRLGSLPLHIKALCSDQ